MPLTPEFAVFGLMLLCIAVFHKRAMEAAIAGLLLLIMMRYLKGNFSVFNDLFGYDNQPGQWKILLNLFGLLTGFEALAQHFESSRLPQHLPNYLPNGWKGAFGLLVIVFILSSFLDNIAAAMIGGAIAHVVFKRKVHLGYIAAIVAASNAGGAGSVIGDTTTTMMWIAGVLPLKLLCAYIAAIVAFMFVAFFASHQQDKYQPVLSDNIEKHPIDKTRLLIVAAMLAAIAAANVLFDFAAVGLWLILLLSSYFRKIPYNSIRQSLKGSFFLLALVFAASLIPVQQLPEPTAHSTFFIGLISAVFNNIPLTSLALHQGGYNYPLLAYAIGFGGSMLWFGSSAGVAISNLYPESRSVYKWLKAAWYIPVAYVAGFLALYFFTG